MSATTTSALVEEATVADGMSARIRDLVCIVENYDPDSEDEDRDDRCPECKTPLGAPEEPGMEPTPFCNCCAHAVVEELAEAVQGLRQVIRQAETARDEALKQSAGWEIQAQDLRDRLVKAEAERDAQHEQVLRLTGELEAAISKEQFTLEFAGSTYAGMYQRLAELTATRDLLTAENARLQAQVATLELLRRGGK